ncbi:hypothetical protein ABBQ38_010782 [Trebouxia sp. C0009 RCD-2024]
MPACPFCAGRAAFRCKSLQAFYPDTAAEWDYSTNQDQPSDYSASSHHMAWWSSPQRGSWQQSIHSRTSQIHQKTARDRGMRLWGMALHASLSAIMMLLWERFRLGQVGPQAWALPEYGPTEAPGRW